jgi:hypothetical protein
MQTNQQPCILYNFYTTIMNHYLSEGSLDCVEMVD